MEFIWGVLVDPYIKSDYLNNGDYMIETGMYQIIFNLSRETATTSMIYKVWMAMDMGSGYVDYATMELTFSEGATTEYPFGAFEGKMKIGPSNSYYTQIVNFTKDSDGGQTLTWNRISSDSTGEEKGILKLSSDGSASGKHLRNDTTSTFGWNNTYARVGDSYFSKAAATEIPWMFRLFNATSGSTIDYDSLPGVSYSLSYDGCTYSVTQYEVASSEDTNGDPGCVIPDGSLVTLNGNEYRLKNIKVGLENSTVDSSPSTTVSIDDLTLPTDSELNLSEVTFEDKPTAYTTIE
jgi:predicted carbohydrate-binding protein with CBM5 and CBM33 domain